MSEQKYYLQDKRSVVGNFLLFWAKGSQGYTTNIDEAEEFTLKEALSHRATDVPWPVEEMRRIAKPRVDHQNLQHSYSEQRERMTRLLAGMPVDSLTRRPKERADYSAVMESLQERLMPVLGKIDCECGGEESDGSSPTCYRCEAMEVLRRATERAAG